MDQRREEISSLPLAQQAARYNQLADDALQRATRVHNQPLRREYLLMAAQWRELADNAKERAMRQMEPLTPATANGRKDQPEG